MSRRARAASDRDDEGDVIMTPEDRLDFGAGGLGRPTVLRFRRTVALGAAGAAIMALLGLSGYVPGLRVLASIRSDYIPMAPSTAGCFLILSVALFCHARKPWQGSGLMAMVALVILVTGFSLLNVAGSFAGMDLNFEDRLASGAGALGEIQVGRMSPATGVAFIVAGLGTCLLLLRSWSSRHVQRLGHWASSLGVLIVLVGATVLLAYLYGAPLMYSGTPVPRQALSGLPG